MLSRRSAATLAMLVALSEAARAETAPSAKSAGPAPAPALKPSAPAKPPTTVQPVDKDQVVAILGRIVTGPEGKPVGRLTDVLVDGTGQPQAAVLDIGGFMGVGMRSIAVAWKTLHFAPWNEKVPITLDLSLDQIQAMPEYKGLTDKPAPVVVATPAKPVPAH